MCCLVLCCFVSIWLFRYIVVVCLGVVILILVGAGDVYLIVLIYLILFKIKIN